MEDEIEILEETLKIKENEIKWIHMRLNQLKQIKNNTSKDELQLQNTQTSHNKK